MTREEAIKEIKERYDFWQRNYADECKDYGEALGMAIDALQEPERKWTPVSERLPDKTGNYLVTSKNCTWVANWFNGTWWGTEKRCRWTDVEAWLPLPECWKGERDG